MDRRRGLLIVVVVGLVARVAYWAIVIPDYVPMSDDGQYFELASNLVHGDGYSLVFPQLELHDTAFRPPLYPAFLASVFALTGGPSVTAGQIANLVIGLVVVGLAYRVGLRLGGTGSGRGPWAGGDRVGFIAGLVVAVYPPLIANDVVLLSEPLSLALLLSLILAAANRWWIWVGLTAGALVLARPSAQFLVVLVVVWVLWHVHRSGGRPLRAAGTVAAVAVLVVAPWVVRNAVVMGEPMLVTSNGFNAAALYSPQAVETGGFVDPVRDHRFDDYRLAQFDEVVWQDELQSLAFSNISENPQILPKTVARNVVAYFQIQPHLTEEAELLDGRNPDLRWLYLGSFYVVLALGSVGLWRARRDEVAQMLIVVSAYFTCASLVFVAWPRVRAPLDLALCLGAAVTIDDAVTRWRTSRTETEVGGEHALMVVP